MKPVVLILRPEPGASATASRARGLGLDGLVRPLFAVHPVDWTPPDPARFEALMLTSANAVRTGGANLQLYHHLPVYAVGDATAEVARAAGFAHVVSGDDDAAALLLRIKADGHANVLHLAGRDRIDAPEVTAVTVYASEMLAGLDLPDSGVALLHSPRAARRLAEIVPERACFAIVAISPAVADAAGSGWARVAVANMPNDAAMLALAARLCETPVR